MKKLSKLALVSVSVLLGGMVLVESGAHNKVQAFGYNKNNNDHHVQFSDPDLNEDSVVDALDLSTLLTNWEKEEAEYKDGDLNGDKKIDALDLSYLLENWSNENEN